MSFARSLEYGQAGESAIAAWLYTHGYYVLPIYEKIVDTGKGPQLFTPTKSLIAPDLLVYKQDKTALWIEAKHKNAFTWHRITQRFVTGIDLRHYCDYCQVADESPWPVWLMFLHEGGQAKDSPPSPDGLYGNTLDHLREHENHRHGNWGSGGMVYWAIENLKKFASLDEVNAAQFARNN